jgi:hypothetical protein
MSRLSQFRAAGPPRFAHDRTAFGSIRLVSAPGVMF